MVSRRLKTDFHGGRKWQGQPTCCPEVGPLEFTWLAYISRKKINILELMRKQQGIWQQSKKSCLLVKREGLRKGKKRNEHSLSTVSAGSHHLILCGRFCYSPRTEVQTGAPKGVTLAGVTNSARGRVCT